MSNYADYKDGFAFKIEKPQNEVNDQEFEDVMQMKKNILLACELTKNTQIANMLKCIDGHGGEKNLFAFLYSVFDDISLAKSLNANFNFKEAFLTEYQSDFINELCEEMAAFLDSSEFKNSSYAAYGRGRVNHLYNLLTKLKLNIKCIEDLVFNNKGMAATNKSLQQHFKLLLKQRLTEHSQAFNDIKTDVAKQHNMQQDRVKYKEEARVQEPVKGSFAKEHLKNKAQQELKAKEMQAEQGKTNNVFDSFKQTTKDFGAQFRETKDVSLQSKDEVKFKEQIKQKQEPEKQKEEEKSKSAGAVCGCGLKVCIKVELERQNPGITFTRKP